MHQCKLRCHFVINEFLDQNIVIKVPNLAVKKIQFFKWFIHFPESLETNAKLTLEFRLLLFGVVAPCYVKVPQLHSTTV